MRVVAAPNAFKESLTARKAAEAIREGVLRACPECEVACVPVADGGDGLLEIVTDALQGELIPQTVQGPRWDETAASFGFVEETGVAVIEMASASGLALLDEKQKNPVYTTTYGTGELIRSAMDKGAKRIIIGLGGSATCDGGIGMAAALGYKFLDKDGRVLDPVGGSLPQICSIDTSLVDERVFSVRFEGVCDVTNPLTGPNGASFVYSPQKGASPEQVRMLDSGLANLTRIVKQDMSKSIDSIPGSGAAGGLGGGLLSFLNASLHKGIDLVMDLVGLQEHMGGADLVITGEGQIDFQTKFDKAPAGVARLAKLSGVPCIAICGSVGERINELYDIGICSVFSLCSGPQTLESAMVNGYTQLTDASEQVMRTFSYGRV